MATDRAGGNADDAGLGNGAVIGCAGVRVRDCGVALGTNSAGQSGSRDAVLHRRKLKQQKVSALKNRYFFPGFVVPAILMGISQASAEAAGDLYKLVLKRHSEYQEGDRGSGSSDDTDVIVVRTIGPQDFEYDLPSSATRKDREVSWQLPARIRLSIDGSMTLLNVAELEIRRDQFLKTAGWTKETCGRWIFTWNAFKIECDPQSALIIVERFQIQPKVLADGSPFEMKGAIGSVPMKCAHKSAGGQTCAVLLPLDADNARRELAESDVVVGEIIGKPISALDAVKSRAETQITGTIEVIFEADLSGIVGKRTTIVHSEQREPGGQTRKSISTSVLTQTKM